MSSTAFRAPSPAASPSTTAVICQVESSSCCGFETSWTPPVAATSRARESTAAPSPGLGLGDDQQRVAVLVRELLGEAVARLPGAEVRRDHADVDWRPDRAKRRQGQDDHDDRGDRGDRAGPGHHAAGEAVPALVSAVGPVADPASAELDVPEREERGGEHARGDRRHDRDDRAADSHRLQEVEGEDRQRRERERDGRRAVDDGAAGRGHRRDDRLPAGPVALELLPVPREQEQRVVDREAETQADHEVEAEDREAVHLVDPAQDEEGRQHRRHADHHRDHRGTRAAEEHDREQEQERERQQLRAAEVLGDLLPELLVGDLRTAEEDVVAVPEPLLGVGDDIGAVRIRGERRGDVGRLAVGGEEAGVLRRRVAGDGGDSGNRLELGGDIGDRRPPARRSRRSRGDRGGR